MKHLTHTRFAAPMGVLLAAIVLLACRTPAGANAYVVIYATADGRTGHAGIAVDNYRVQTMNGISFDTVADGTLTYYDLWPEKDDFRLFRLSKNLGARYYRLPNAIWPGDITVNALLAGGIPHREHYPCDALLMVRTTVRQDHSLAAWLDSVMQSGRAFNARFFNCSDFVLQGLRHATGRNIRAKEFLPFAFSTTPNKLCRRLMQCGGVVVLRSPGNKINGSFFRERVLKRRPPDDLFAFN